MYSLKRYIRDHEKLMNILSFIYRIVMFNFMKARGLKLQIAGSFLKQSKASSNGLNNVLIIGEGCRINKCIFHFHGDGNCVVIDNDCVLNETEFWISGGGCVSIGEHTHVVGKIHIACIEGKKVIIGKRSLFSSEIAIRTGDSHSIVDENGKRINLSKDIIIGEHVWIGQRTTLLKGIEIGNNTVIGAMSLVTKSFPDNCVIGGNPAHILRIGTTWCPELIVND